MTADSRFRLHESWARTRTHLSHAAGLIPATPVESIDGGRLELYREFAEHNELELALDVLVRLGDLNIVPPEFWVSLRDAAQEMALTQYVVRLEQRL